MAKHRITTLPARVQSAPQRAAVSSTSWRGGKATTSARGYGWRWQQYRVAYLAKHPLCVMCETKRIVTSAAVVDHKIPHKGDARLFWDELNHQALCVTCHDVDKARAERAAGLR